MVAKQTRKTNPGEAANAFVRVILSDAGAMLGGLDEDERRRTLAGTTWQRQMTTTGRTLNCAFARTFEAYKESHFVLSSSPETNLIHRLSETDRNATWLAVDTP